MSAIDIDEQTLVRWAFAEGPAQRVLLPAVGVQGRCAIGFGVGAPVIESARRVTGELDVMLWPDGHPSLAVAIECKRLKIDSATMRTEQIGKLAEIRKAVHQANGHVRRGFHRVFLAVFAVVDARNMSGGTWLGGGLTDSLLRLVRDPSHVSGLDPSVGVLLVEVRQPVDKDVRLGGGVGLIGQRPALAREQDASLTRRIASYHSP